MSVCRTPRPRLVMLCGGALLASVPTTTAVAQQLAPEFAVDYEVVDLGEVPGLPGPYGGLVFSADDPDVLLIGGAANSSSAAVYAVEVVRGCDAGVIGFAGEAVLVATAPNIDGGLTYGPDDVLFYTAFPVNVLGQILPGEGEPARIIDLSDLGVSSSTGTLQFVPAGFPGAGSLKIASYSSSDWYDATIAPAGDGTFDVTSVEERTNVGGGPEGIVYIDPSNPGFDVPSVIVCQYQQGEVAAFEIDADGDPIPSTERLFLDGLVGAEGATLDPVTGEFVFSTFGGGSRVVLVRGFELGCPEDVFPRGGDGTVSFDDLLEVLASWGEECTGPDVDRSGSVDFDDVLAVLAAWGDC